MGLVARLVGDRVAAGQGDQAAFTDETLGVVSYRALHDAVRRYATRLRKGGCVMGTRGLVVSDDSAGAVLACLALWANGCVAVPVSPLLTDEEIAFIARDSAATLVHFGVPEARRRALRPLLADGLAVFTAEEANEAFDERAVRGHEVSAAFGEEEGAEAEVLLQYTSGSTGRPKGVRQSLRGLLAVIDGFGRRVPLKPGDVVLSTAKLSFGYGFGSSLLCPLAAGAHAVLLAGPVDVYTLLAALRRHRPTVLCTVPRMYALLLEHVRDRSDLASLRLGLSAGEHLPDELSGRFTARFGTPLVDALGATEAGHIVLIADEGPRRGAVPVPGVTATVRDERGRVVSGEEPGRLHVRGASVALGYLDRPEQDREVFADGGVYTGDIVSRTAEGRLAYLCRADDVLNLGGHKVAPSEIEAVVGGVPGVARCAVVAGTDEAGLAQAIAYVVPEKAGAEEDLGRAVRAAIRKGLAAYKRPAQVRFVDELPTTSTGKLARYRLRDQVNRG
ncbi:class I adenylate-forming enzyme family protein [Actinomadura rugatobispora]|uniref:Class I adenylate-forming enzyme family protein n=1 Tax=Actinomadura rugatobispora TaxID=1994 RepID=A0ABW1AD45_9ACTN|nr:benzoate-CoA ligase family protein [Actinomadura rugatobispora]